MNTASKLQKYLTSVGINKVYGIVGREAAAILFDEAQPDIDFILTRHELSAGLMAISESKLKSNTPQVCFATLGPGATNLMTAVGTAFLDRHPLIAIVAQVETNAAIYNDVHQCIDPVSVAKPITKFTYELKSPKELKWALESAINASMSQPMGPSLISIPVDILLAEYPDSGDRLDVSNYQTSTYSVSPSHDNELIKAINLIRNSKNPMVIAGDTVVKVPGLTNLVKKFCIDNNIPLVTTYSAKGILPPNHHLNYEAINSYMDVIIEYEGKKTIFSESDALILVGYDMVEHYPNAWKNTKEKKIINLNCYHNSAASQMNLEANVIGNIESSLDKISSAISDIKYNCSGIKQLKDIINNKLADTKVYKDGVLVNQILGSLDRHYDSYILCNDIGTHRHVTALYYRAQNPNDYITSAGFSSFGTGLPLGIGAKLAAPNRNVVVMAGDGGFHSNSGDLETAVRMGVKMTIIVLNNNANGLIKRYQLSGPSRRNNPRSTDFSPIDFAMLAKANGCQGIRVNNLKDFTAALDQADKFNGPTLIEVPVHYPDFFINSFSVINKK